MKQIVHGAGHILCLAQAVGRGVAVAAAMGTQIDHEYAKARIGKDFCTEQHILAGLAQPRGPEAGSPGYLLPGQSGQTGSIHRGI